MIRVTRMPLRAWSPSYFSILKKRKWSAAIFSSEMKCSLSCRVSVAMMQIMVIKSNWSLTDATLPQPFLRTYLPSSNPSSDENSFWFQGQIRPKCASLRASSVPQSVWQTHIHLLRFWFQEQIDDFFNLCDFNVCDHMLTLLISSHSFQFFRPHPPAPHCYSPIYSISMTHERTCKL